MPHKTIINGREIEQFDLEEIQSDKWLNSNVPMFTGKDIVETLAIVGEQPNNSTGEYYLNLSRAISCVNDENDRSEAWFLKEENIELIKNCLEYCSNEAKYVPSREKAYDDINSLLKTIQNGNR